MTPLQQHVFNEIQAGAPAGTSTTLLAQLMNFVGPLLTNLGSHINTQALITTILMSLATGGGLPGVIKAILAAIPTIITAESQIAKVVAYSEGHLALHDAVA